MTAPVCPDCGTAKYMRPNGRWRCGECQRQYMLRYNAALRGEAPSDSCPKCPNCGKAMRVYTPKDRPQFFKCTYRYCGKTKPSAKPRTAAQTKASDKARERQETAARMAERIAEDARKHAEAVAMALKIREDWFASLGKRRTESRSDYMIRTGKRSPKPRELRIFERYLGRAR